MNGAHGQIVHHHVVLVLVLVHEHVLSNTMEWTVMGCQLRTVTANNHHVRTVEILCLVCYRGKDVGLVLTVTNFQYCQASHNIVSLINCIHFFIIRPLM